MSNSVMKILEGEKILENMADALLVLIPKLENPNTIKQFRPISLCNVTFKLVTKVIMNRLKQIMEEVVSPNQSSFVSRRQTTDNITDMGLPQKLVKVIMKCVTRASFRLIWNGECTELVQQSRGIGQGDPISPCVFVLCLERLAQRI